MAQPKLEEKVVSIPKNEAGDSNQAATSKIGGIFGTIFPPLFGLIIALVVAEIGFRIIEPGLSAPSWRDRPTFYYKPEAAKTLQGNSYQAAKPSGTYRIAVLGDSFTFAPYMQFDDAFPKRLERMLNLNNDAPRVEVINYGVPGYSTKHEVDALRRAHTEGADLAILQITLNDPQIKPYTPTGLTGKNQFGPPTLSGFQKTLYEHWRSLGFVMARIHNAQTHTAYREYYFDLFENTKTKKHFEESLNRIAKVSRNKNLPVIAVVFPLLGLPLDDSYPFHPLHDQVRDELDRLSIPSFDLFQAYQGLPLARIQVEPGKDFHPNEIGHRIAAEAIYQWLVNASYIPDALVIRSRYSTRTDIRPEKSGELVLEEVREPVQ